MIKFRKKLTLFQINKNILTMIDKEAQKGTNQEYLKLISQV